MNTYQTRVSGRRAPIIRQMGAPSGIVSRFTATLIGGGSALPLATGAPLLATVFYGFAVSYSKRHLAGVNAFVVAFGSQVSASILLVPLALFFWPKHSVAPSTWACVAALGVICTGFAYVLFFRLAERVGAAYAASVTFLIHIFGIIWGAAFLGEGGPVISMQITTVGRFKLNKALRTGPI